MSETTTPRMDEAKELSRVYSVTTQAEECIYKEGCQLERELAEAKSDDALNARILAQHSEQIAELQEERRDLEEQLTAHKAALDTAKTALISITSGHFYQSSCRGGEMERLINQAIHSLASVNPNQSSQ